MWALGSARLCCSAVQHDLTAGSGRPLLPSQSWWAGALRHKLAERSSMCT